MLSKWMWELELGKVSKFIMVKFNINIKIPVTIKEKLVITHKS